MSREAWARCWSRFDSLRGGTAAWRAIYAGMGVILAAVFWYRMPAMPQLEFGFSADYVQVMRDIDRTGSYLRVTDDGRLVPTTFREPFYPYALRAADWAFGYYGWLVPFQAAAVTLVCLTWVFVAWRRMGFIWAAGLSALLCLNQPLLSYPALLYPYAFNVCLLSTGLLCVAALISRRRWGWAVGTGVCFGLAAYERGSLLLLPLLLGGCLWLFPARVSRRAVLALVAAFGLTVAPWLARNARLGFFGMHGLMGLTLGYTYGNLILTEDPPPPDPYGLRAEYARYLRQLGPDGGSWAFLHDLDVRGYDNAAMNRIFGFYVRQAVRLQPAAARAIVWRSLRMFPCRLVQFRVPVRGDDLWSYYVDNLCLRPATAADWTVTVAGLLGFILMLLNREWILLAMAPVMFYLIPIDTLLTVFDPRYRNGVFDIFLCFMALYALRFLVRALRRPSQRLHDGPELTRLTA